MTADDAANKGDESSAITAANATTGDTQKLDDESIQQKEEDGGTSS